MHWIGLVGILILVGCGGGTPTSSDKVITETKEKDQSLEILRQRIRQDKNLKKLDLGNTGLKTLPDLSELTALEELELRKYPGKAWTVPANLPLQKIMISKGTTNVIVPENLRSKVLVEE